ncbi:stage II sporulation protein E [Lentzea atacamensis]|uniref:Stage II sporulation protein E n=1 Tax=Lentzea atacamensis TaxID=531938 RepID=A0ABX9EB45_9PSEU|nr:SpoIIE family protein phosphatase [Lentzea atacamensis]RAS67384.1 stage II sporulation protein E [Lentzea atacamensis]
MSRREQRALRAIERTSGSTIRRCGALAVVLFGATTGSCRPAVTFETSLRPGDVLVVYTDGLVEHRENDIDTGIQSLCDAVTAPHLPERLDDLVPAVINAVAPQEARDDICVLALRHRPGR